MVESRRVYTEFLNALVRIFRYSVNFQNKSDEFCYFYVSKTLYSTVLLYDTFGVLTS